MIATRVSRRPIVPLCRRRGGRRVTRRVRSREGLIRRSDRTSAGERQVQGATFGAGVPNWLWFSIDGAGGAPTAAVEGVTVDGGSVDAVPSVVGANDGEVDVVDEGDVVEDVEPVAPSPDGFGDPSVMIATLSGTTVPPRRPRSASAA